MTSLKSPIHIKGSPGQISKILQQRKKRKKDSHRRQHDRHDPCDGPIYSGYGHVYKPWCSSKGSQAVRQLLFNRKEQAPQKLRGVICTDDGKPEDPRQHQAHKKHSGKGAGKEPVKAFFSFSMILPGIGDRASGQLGRGKGRRKPGTAVTDRTALVNGGVLVTGHRRIAGAVHVISHRRIAGVVIIVCHRAIAAAVHVISHRRIATAVLVTGHRKIAGVVIVAGHRAIAGAVHAINRRTITTVVIRTQLCQRFPELLHALFCSSAAGNDRNAKFLFHKLQIDLYTFSGGFIP